LAKLRSTVGAVGVSATTVGLTAIVFAGSAFAGYQKSHAWAGYQANQQQFRFVAASWTVPAIKCAGNGRAASFFWVGLGAGNSDSERVEVREFCTGSLPSYATYIEMNAETEVQAIIPAPGDAISASIYYVSGKYRFWLADSTQGKSFSHKYSCGHFSSGQGTCSRSTAEVGAGISFPGSSPLADYTRVSFHNVAITDVKGQRGCFAKNRYWKVASFAEFDGTKLAASPSALSQRGTRFANIWRHR
jgi:hypothetical protein